jgi:hypothetical protein
MENKMKQENEKKANRKTERKKSMKKKYCIRKDVRPKH